MSTVCVSLEINMLEVNTLKTAQFLLKENKWNIIFFFSAEIESVDFPPWFKVGKNIIPV